VITSGESGTGGSGAGESSTAPTEYTVTVGSGPDYCVIAAPPNGQLTRSLVGWGSKTLPLTQN
jgi:hypothetical protein